VNSEVASNNIYQTIGHSNLYLSFCYFNIRPTLKLSCIYCCCCGLSAVH